VPFLEAMVLGANVYNRFTEKTPSMCSSLVRAVLELSLAVSHIHCAPDVLEDEL
jgi:hypothetical protein